MAAHTQEPERVARYVTVQDAVEQTGVTERTIRRWIKDGKVHTIRDTSNFVRLDLAQIEHIAQVKAATTPFLRQQIERLQQRIQGLESDKEALVQKYADLQRQVEAKSTDLQRQVEGVVQLFSQYQATDGGKQPFSLIDFLGAQVPLRQQTGNTQGRLEKRGLPPGTIRLVDFVKIHEANLWDLKQLHGAGTITLSVYQRDGQAKRNKQEWWITPEQHLALAAYWHAHERAWTPCSVCSGVTEENEVKEA